jgi:hypothetical protein
MGTLMGRFLFGDLGVLFWFVDEPAPTMWILVWGLLLIGLGSIAYDPIHRCLTVMNKLRYCCDHRCYCPQ